MAENIVVLNVDGQTFHLKKHLTVGETLELSGKRYALTNGQYDALDKSDAEGDKGMAFLADVVAEFDIRIIKAPDDWPGAENTKDTKLLMDMWKAWRKESGFFRTPDSVAEDTTEGGTEGEGEEVPPSELDESMVQEEVQSPT